MKGQTKQAFSRVLDWVCCSLGLTLISGSATAQACSSEQQERLLVPESKDVPISEISTLRDAATQTSPATAIIPLPVGPYCKSQSSRAEQSAWTDSWRESEDRSQDDNCSGEQDPQLTPGQYTDGPNRIVKVTDGTEDCIAFMLTEETVMLLADVIRQRKRVRSIVHDYQEISHIAGTGQDFLDYAPVMLEEATSQEEYHNLTKDIERRRLEISRNVERKDCLEKHLHSKEQDLNDSRGQLEDDLERMLVEAKLAHDHGLDRTIYLEMMSSTGIPEDDEMSAQQSPTAETELADPDPMEDVWSARQRLFEAQVEFDELPELQEQQKRQYRCLRREEQADFPESELDLLQLQDARRATRALIEAEEAFEEVRARAHADGILSNDIDSEITLSEYTGMGSGADYDPALVNPSFDPTRVQAWAEKVPQCQGQEDTDPEVDEWDSRTVTMSDSISVIAEGNERRLLDRWECICDSFRKEAYKSDIGAMGNAGCL